MNQSDLKFKIGDKVILDGERAFIGALPEFLGDDYGIRYVGGIRFHAAESDLRTATEEEWPTPEKESSKRI